MLVFGEAIGATLGIYRGRSRGCLDYFGGCGEHWGRIE